MDPFFYFFPSSPSDDPELYDYYMSETFAALGNEGAQGTATDPYQKKYDGVLRKYPWLKNDHPRNHCQGAAKYFTDQVLVTKGDEPLLIPYDSPKRTEAHNNDDFFFKVDCEILTLSDVIETGKVNKNATATHHFDAGVLSFYQVRGKTLYIPDRICQNIVQSWTPYHIGTLEDFKKLPEALSVPFDSEEQGWAFCEESGDADPIASFPNEPDPQGIGGAINVSVSHWMDDDGYLGGLELGYVDEDDPTAGLGSPKETIKMGIQYFLGTHGFNQKMQDLLDTHFGKNRNIEEE